MDTDLLELIRPALDEMIAAEPTLVWSVVATKRDSVEFEREDKFASVFWDGSARYRWMVTVAGDEETHLGDTLADVVAASGILL